ncbi:hypothetical protein [Ammoniphilus resinae]|nr:hypothetical protein [Ammoniphilus resinae]
MKDKTLRKPRRYVLHRAYEGQTPVENGGDVLHYLFEGAVPV